MNLQFLGAAASLALAGFLVTSVAADVPSNEVPSGLKAAIRDKVEGEGHQYAGLCRDIEQHNHPGEYCAFVLSIDGNWAEVTYGPVLSEPTAHIAFQNVDGHWEHHGGGPGEGEPKGPYWVNDLEYGSSGGGFYWDSVSNQVWTGERGWHAFGPQPARTVSPLWVNHLSYGSAGGGFYLDPLAGQVWTAERGWHLFSPA
jgi:hypothetical protein